MNTMEKEIFLTDVEMFSILQGFNYSEETDRIGVLDDYDKIVDLTTPILVYGRDRNLNPDYVKAKEMLAEEMRDKSQQPEYFDNDED